jgi:hypothetical protein
VFSAKLLNRRFHVGEGDWNKRTKLESHGVYSGSKKKRPMAPYTLLQRLDQLTAMLEKKVGVKICQIEAKASAFQET